MNKIAEKKQPSTKLEPLLDTLVIQDLVEMEKTGSYDRNVLLWMQNGYVQRAIKEHISELKQLHTRLIESGTAPTEVNKQKFLALVKYTRESYSSQKSSGGGADLKRYFDAAVTFWEAESVRYGGQLKEVAEYIQKALENGEKPDPEKYARHCYISFAKLASAASHLEGLNKPSAQEVAKLIRQGVEDINFSAVGDQKSKDVGREIMKVVNHIAQNPKKYIEFRDPGTILQAEKHPWDFEPMHRQDRSMEY